jgi:hypothetical protein
MKATTPLHLAFDPIQLQYPKGTGNMSTLTSEGRREQIINSPANLFWLPVDVHQLFDRLLIRTCPYQGALIMQAQHGQGNARFQNLRSLGMGVGRKAAYATDGQQALVTSESYHVSLLYQSFASLERYNYTSDASTLPLMRNERFQRQMEVDLDAVTAKVDQEQLEKEPTRGKCLTRSSSRVYLADNHKQRQVFPARPRTLQVKQC